MKAAVIIGMIATLALASGCQDKPKTEAPAKQQAAATLPEGHPPVGDAKIDPKADPHAGLKATSVPKGIPTKKATVVQTIDADVYTYIEAKGDDGKTVWMAMPTIKVAKGAKIEYPTNVPPITNFTSKTLKKTFESILFLQGVTIVK
ncbi:MAG: hypothetical protein WBI04_05170 [Trichlorobacter sp.]